MSGTATPFGYDVPGWLPGTRHYFTDDGRVLAVKMHVDPEDAGSELVNEAISQALVHMGETDLTVVESPTHIIECRPDGLTDSLSPVHVCDDVVEHHEALAEYGYTVQPTEMNGETP